MLSLSAYSCREAFLINYIIKKLEKCKKWPENGLEKCMKLAVFTCCYRPHHIPFPYVDENGELGLFCCFLL